MKTHSVFTCLSLVPFCVVLALSSTNESANAIHHGYASSKPAAGCFPALGFSTPATVPSDATLASSWWCNADTEHAFLGFSYEVTGCQSKAQLYADFFDMRLHFGARYVRLYGACDRAGFYDDVVEAAYSASMGVHALVWFGFDGDNSWEGRRDRIFDALRNNRKAKFVTRTVQFGSEPLFDNAIPHGQLTTEVQAAKNILAAFHVPVTVSELAYGYQVRGAQDVLDTVSSIHAHILPFFAQSASTAKQAWPLVNADLQWFITHGKGKKIYFSQNGWPSATSPGVQPNSPYAISNVQNERDYYQLLDDHCADLKRVPRGVGWFAHIYSDAQEPGYGIYDSNGRLKFPFKPKTGC